MAPAVDPVAAATYFVTRLGCTAFPVWGSRAGRCLCGDPHTGEPPATHDPENVGKHPATAHGFMDATADLARIKTFLANPGTPNYGLNAPTGVLVLDVDGDGLARWAELEKLYGALPPTLTTLTANGRHYFFRWPDVAGPMPTGKLFGYVVRRHDDGYVIGPGSVHPTGVVYDTLRQPNGMPYDIAELPPAWAAAAVRPTPTFTTGGKLPDPGERHDWLRDRARFYRGVIDDPVVVRAAMLAENDRLPVPKTPAAVERAIGRVFELFPADPPEVVQERVGQKLGDDELGLLSRPTAGGFPAPPEAVAFDGLLGGCVEDIAPGTDASLVALLGSLIAFAGALVPGAAYFHRVQTSSPFIALVGESSIGRKGTAMMRAHDAMSSAIEPIYVNRVILDGLNSGEGLVSTLHYKREAFPHEPTVGLVFEEEYAGLLASRQREGSTLDPKMRQAFDGGPLSNRRSGDTKIVVPPYWLPALIAITPTELQSRLEGGALRSGSANRWLYLAVVKRSTSPKNDEPSLSRENRRDLVAARRAALEERRQPLTVDPVVTRTLADYADFLPTVSHGISTELGRRLGVIAFRIALVHALVERSPAVTIDHLRRAIALTEYGRQGIPWIFGETIGSPDADLLLRNLVAAGQLTKREITQQIIRDPLRRQMAIDELVHYGRAEVVTTYPEKGGRPRTNLVATAVSGEFRAFGAALYTDRASDSRSKKGDRANVQGIPPAPVDDADSALLHETSDLSTKRRARSVHDRCTIGAQTARSVHETPDGPDVAEAARSVHETPPESPTCRDYSAHQSKHRWAGDRWVCDACEPPDES